MARNSQSRAPVSRLVVMAWCSFDWANQSFPTVIMTFVFAAYYTKGVAPDEITGTSQWAYMMSASMLVVAFTGPVLGAIADQYGRRKLWICAFSVLCIGASAGLWFVSPDSSSVYLALILVALGNIGFETATIFYNAMLPSLAPPALTGRISGWGWGLGYAGGLVCLAAVLLLLIQPDPPLFPLDRDAAEHLRASGVLVALWFALFALPFFIVVPDVPSTGITLRKAVNRGLGTLLRTFREVRRYRQIALYLLARMIYTDGLNTVFAIGGIYAAVTFAMDFDEILLFGIAINVAAGLGAFAFGWIDDWIGPKRTVLIALAALTILGAAVLLVTSKTWFWISVLPLGMFFGPTQSASRTLMARMAPEHLEGEMFGLYALSGKATAFFGPVLFGFATSLADSQRAGLATVLAFFVIGGLLLMAVREPTPKDRPSYGRRIDDVGSDVRQA
ncbi:MAG: MFS transporter [Hyphomicrobiales bacterium]|nr:MFS transporter [Hyphomicrobiales bacterium]